LDDGQSCPTTTATSEREITCIQFGAGAEAGDRETSVVLPIHPHDLHDWDAVQVPVLIDAQFQGRPRKLLAQGNRNGFFYVLDRINGQLLLAKPFVQN